MAVTIAVESPLQDDVRALIAALNEFLLTLTPPEFCSHLTVEQMADAETTVFIARDEGRAVACGALRRHGAAVGEVKRMYTLPSYQGQGIGGRILAMIEGRARRGVHAPRPGNRSPSRCGLASLRAGRLHTLRAGARLPVIRVFRVLREADRSPLNARPHPGSNHRPVAAGLAAIGDTPLVRLRASEPEGGAEIWVKWEVANPTGSMKDRMAVGMIAHGEQTGALLPGMRVVEYTGGSTGSSLAMVCAALGYRAHLVTADCFAPEKIRTMRAFGAEVEVLESDGGKVTPELFDRFKVRIAELADEPDTWWAEQFVDPGNAAGYRALGQEIVEELVDGIDGFVMGMGTGGCCSGVAAVLKARHPRSGASPSSPRRRATSPAGRSGDIDSTGSASVSRPPGARLDLADEIAAVSDEDAFASARALARREGLFAGQTSGANVFIARRLAVDLGEGRRVVTVLVDSGLEYLAGDLFDE